MMRDDTMSPSKAVLPILRDMDRVPDPPSMQPLGAHVQEVFDCICSGWSNGMVIAHLKGKYDFAPPLELIQQYRKLVPPESILPMTALYRHFGGLRIIVDPLVDLQLLLRLEQERLSAELEQEKLTGEINPAVDRRLKAYFNHLVQFAELTQQNTSLLMGDTNILVMPLRDAFEAVEQDARARREIEINGNYSERQETGGGLHSPPVLGTGD